MPTAYKNEPGTWMDVSRHVLFDSENCAFQTRYFEISMGGYTSFEKHAHEHCVVVLHGSGRVRLGDQWHDLEPGDVVGVESWTPHQFAAATNSTLGILCIVDRERDRPVLLQEEGNNPGSGAFY